MVQVFRDGQLLRALDLNNAFTAVKTEAFAAAISQHENQIYVNGTWYQRTGVASAPDHATPTAKGALYGSSFSVDITVPPGYTVAYTVADAGAGYAFCMTDKDDSKKVWYATTIPYQITKVNWTLIKK